MSYFQHLGKLENKFRLLDQIPDELYSIIVTHSHGQLNLRIQGILQWRDAFLKGHLPQEDTLVWPESVIKREILKRFEVLEIVQYCKEQSELTDSILKDVCAAISSFEAYQDIDQGFDDRLAREQKKRDKDCSFKDPDNPANENSNNNQDPGDRAENDNNTVNAQSYQQDDVNAVSDTGEGAVKESVDELIEHEVVEDVGSSQRINTDTNTVSQSSILGDSIIEENWQELAQQWQQLESVFSELSGLLGRGWDLTQGLLASQGWRDIIRYRKLVRELPWLEQVIASLGRLREKSGDELQTISEQVIEPVRRMVEDDIEVRTPNAVYETSGIRRSDDISRLLPGELAQLGHPQLKMLWHAKRAEHTLLTYQVDGVLSEHEPVEQEELEQTTRTMPENEKGYGPIIVCLDSSASMQGEPENVAKAIVLEALRIAWQEDRACYVYLFSGPEQILEHNLDLTRGGLAELLAFLRQTFHGGTDIIRPLMAAMAKQKQENWHEADIMLVSDGRFPITSEQQQQIKHLRKKSQSRLHSVLIGHWKGSGLQEVCDCFHRVNV